MTFETSKFKQNPLNLIKPIFRGYLLHDKLYLIGFGVIISYLAVTMIALFIFKINITKTLETTCIYLSAPTCTVAVVIEYWVPIKALFKNTGFRWFLAGVGVVALKFSEIRANVFINDFTDIDPGYLPVASSTLTTLFLLYAWSLVVSAFLGVFMFAQWVLSKFEAPKGTRQPGDWKYLARLIGLLSIFVLISSAGRTFEVNDSLTARFARQLILATEYFKQTHCSNLGPDQLSASMADELISVYTPSSENFNVIKCMPPLPE